MVTTNLRNALREANKYGVSPSYSSLRRALIKEGKVEYLVPGTYDTHISFEKLQMGYVVHIPDELNKKEAKPKVYDAKEFAEDCYLVYKTAITRLCKEDFAKWIEYSNKVLATKHRSWVEKKERLEKGIEQIREGQEVDIDCPKIFAKIRDEAKKELNYRQYKDYLDRCFCIFLQKGISWRLKAVLVEEAVLKVQDDSGEY
jgi:hypothetical protein